MPDERILNICEILDESGQIRPRLGALDRLSAVPDGPYSGVNDNGQKVLEVSYNHGVINGAYVEFWSNGNIATEGQFKDGSQEGTWRYFDMSGVITEVIQFQDGKEITYPKQKRKAAKPTTLRRC